MLNDPEVRVPLSVKETRYFLGQIDDAQHRKLFSAGKQPKIEIDTALCTEDLAAERIAEHNHDCNVVIIFRSPVDFAVSRFVHARRKGETVSESIEDAIRYDRAIRRELDYPEIADRFSSRGLNTTLIRFDALELDASNFYLAIKHALTGLRSTIGPSIQTPVNVARDSRLPLVSGVLASAASSARKRGLHRLVNVAKAVGVHQRLERRSSDTDLDELRLRALPVLEEEFPGLTQYFESLS